MHVLVRSQHMYLNIRTSTYWYVRVRSVSVYSTSCFEMSRLNYQNTYKYGVNAFFVDFLLSIRTTTYELHINM